MYSYHSIYFLDDVRANEIGIASKAKEMYVNEDSLKISSWSYELQSLAVFLGFVGLCVCVYVCCSLCLFYKFSRQNSVNKSLIV